MDDVSTLTAAADLLKQRGAYKVYVMATHGILSQDAPQLIEDSEIDEVRGRSVSPCNETETEDFSAVLTVLTIVCRRIYFFCSFVSMSHR